jgi:hypothetical protein
MSRTIPFVISVLIVMIICSPAEAKKQPTLQDYLLERGYVLIERPQINLAPGTIFNYDFDSSRSTGGLVVEIPDLSQQDCFQVPISSSSLWEEFTQFFQMTSSEVTRSLLWGVDEGDLRAAGIESVAISLGPAERRAIQLQNLLSSMCDAGMGVRRSTQTDGSLGPAEPDDSCKNKLEAFASPQLDACQRSYITLSVVTVARLRIHFLGHKRKLVIDPGAALITKVSKTLGGELQSTQAGEWELSNKLTIAYGGIAQAQMLSKAIGSSCSLPNLDLSKVDPPDPQSCAIRGCIAREPTPYFNLRVISGKDILSARSQTCGP